MKLRNKICLLVTGCALLATTLGCEAFVRKFTRKPKKEDLPQEEMVLAPEEYKGPQMSTEELFRQYFLFWKSWQDEIITSLSGKLSHKRQLSCTEEALKNLNNLKELLNQEMQKKIDIYIGQLGELRTLIAQDVYSNNASFYIQKAERIKRNVLRDFSYQKIKDYLL
jgi:hypothetical protein